MLQLKQNLVSTIIFIIFNLIVSTNSFSQYCDSLVPSFAVDLSASPIMNWISAPIVRDGNCCGTTSPDQCLEFVITLNAGAIAVSFDIASGAVPPGALFYQIDCGPPTPVGSPICLTGPGPHTLTFCKPGNNPNTFSITSYSSPIIGPDITLNTGCQGFIYANYYNEASINWTSIGPGIPGAYDYLLSCTGGCDTSYITAPVNPPTYIDYLVCGMDIGGCNPLPICDTIRVNFISGVTVNISALTTSLCLGETTTLTANASGGVAPYVYAWNTAEVSSSIIVGPGTYYVDVVDTSGCYVATDTMIILQYTPPVIIAGADQIVCEGTPITLNGSGGISYTWNNGVVDGISFAQAPGMITYTVIGTDINGCTNTDQVNVTVNPNPIVDAGSNQFICENEILILSGSGAISYVWDNGVIDGIGFIPAVGTINYTVIGTDINGCTGTDIVMITVTPLPTVNAGNDTLICDGNSIVLNATGTSTYNWDNGVVNGVPFYPTIGNTLYTVIGIDTYGCSNTDQVMVTVVPLPNINAGVNQTVCEGTPITLTASAGISYTWDNGVVNGVPFAQAPGFNTYTVIGTDINGCTNTDQVNVTVNPNPIVDAGPNQFICENEILTLSGSGAVSYVWDNGVINGIGFLPAVGTINYTVIGTDLNGCTGTDIVMITVTPLPTVNAGNDTLVCDGNSVTLNATGTSGYNWDNGVVNGVPFNPTLGNTLYTVIGIDMYGCSNSDQVLVTVVSLPNVNAGLDQIVCVGTPVTLTASGSMNYSWNNGVLDGISFIPTLGTTEYIVNSTNVYGCSNSDTVQVLVNPEPVVNAGADLTVCFGEDIILSATGSANLYWNNAVINNVSFTPSVGITQYIVTDSLSTGCLDRDTVLVEVFPNPVISAENDTICEGNPAVLTGQGALYYSWSNGIGNGVQFYPNSTGNYTLTGTSADGCTSEITVAVIVNPAPVANFNIINNDLNTNNSTTGFVNYSSGATNYEWFFGDWSATSTEFQPTHTFPYDEGATYEVTLVAYSPEGCRSEVTQYIVIDQSFSIYVPNAFTPDANGVNEVFNPVLEGFEEQDYTLYIFNRWGELIFESHDMNVGWDGTYAGKFEQVQDGVCTWKIIARVKNSAEDKMFVGHVSLLK